MLGTRDRRAHRHCWWPRNERARSTLAGRRYDYLIVGAGFAGSVLAERLASQHGARVLLIDRRPHVGGNAYDETNEAGILYHKYGPHIFHTNSEQVVEYLSQFTEWRPYEHRVRAMVRGQLVPIPINRTTLNKLFDARPEDRRGSGRLSRVARRAGRRHPDVRGRGRSTPSGASSTSCSSAATRASNGASIRASSTSRSRRGSRRGPTPTTAISADTFQAMPLRWLHGDVRADARPSADRGAHRRRFRRVQGRAHEIADHIIYTGPIDEYFDFRFGKLPYRSLKFDHQTLEQEWLQPVAVGELSRSRTCPTRGSASTSI